ncbi:zinc transport system substrate-binding protein [Alkalihalobacillus xiaoxiensis]|uniref:Zinc transport system substrate-binding protein n=1 Tax=Shouchella xiaoxiensis TaxID=766895 RepID=A0ABS2SNV8_9BACI|nr:metal-binding protein ZinT [Shouchella xiaoxiensis]MBM7837213.1 zinc transport system substrate-binding protein [Shouchella xiaoxiensis]
MNKHLFTWSSVVFVALIGLSACQQADDGESVSADDQGTAANEVPENIMIEGLAGHYHTNDAIMLEASYAGELEYDRWKWIEKNPETNEWDPIAGQENADFTGTAEVDGQEIKVVLVDEQDTPIAQSLPVVISIDDHGHGHDEESQAIYAGYFEDEQIEDRELSDWEGDWQSVYPYLLDGSLDDVFAHKAAESDDQSAEEYKDYYTVGYETDVDRIVIEDAFFHFYQDGVSHSSEYEYDGYEVLTYEKGNRGVRYIFKQVEESTDMPTYIQFSDHSIFPTDSHHFHLYWGDDREALLDEVTNWPTYYPADLNAEVIAREMMAH